MSDRRGVLYSQGEVRPGLRQGQYWGPRQLGPRNGPGFRDASSRLYLRGMIYADVLPELNAIIAANRQDGRHRHAATPTASRR